MVISALVLILLASVAFFIGVGSFFLTSLSSSVDVREECGYLRLLLLVLLGFFLLGG